MVRCPVCNKHIVYKWNLARHIKNSADSGDKNHLEYLRRGAPAPSAAPPAPSALPLRPPDKGQAPSAEGAQPPRRPFSYSSPESAAAPTGADLTFPKTVPTDFVAAPAPGVPAAPAVIASENTEQLLEVLYELSEVLREGDIKKFGKLTKAEIALLARAIARRRGKDVDDTVALLTVGGRYLAVVLGNLVIGVMKIMKARKEKKAAEEKAKAEAAAAKASAPAPGVG